MLRSKPVRSRLGGNCYFINSRSAAGQGMIVLTLLIAVLVIFAVGLFSYEVNRLEICRSQLRSACEAAALAAAATLASQDNIDPSAAHEQAIQTALTTFKTNSVGGTKLTETSLVYNGEDYPAKETGSLFIEFLDPNRNNEPVDVGDPAGKLVRITAAFGLQPSFGNFLGLSTVPLRTTSAGGVPELDVVLCFDVSGSIDDQTPVTFVKRHWTGTTATGRTLYTITRTRSGSRVTGNANGRIYDIIGPVPSGTRLNAVPPQYMASSSQSDVRWPLNFSENFTATRNLRGRQETGAPPGNHPQYSTPAGIGDQYCYTDVVVNIDGRNVFAGITSDGYAFPDIATVVEASRGNLENATVFSNSGANRSVPATVSPRPGYRAKYLQLARANLHPLGDAQRAAAEFFTIMNTNTRGHFSVICFSDNAGVSATTTYGAANIDSAYTAGGNGSFPVPNIPLSNVEGVTRYNEIQAMLPTTVATTATNIGEALDRAVTQLNNNSRPGSKKAIVLFTDGMPTAPSASTAEPNSRAAAVRARNAGIPIYSIGLAQNPEIVPLETAILTHTNSSPTSGGVSGIARNGGIFFLVTDVADLRKTFENIARQLVALVH